VLNLAVSNKREYLALPLDLCYFDRGRYDKMQDELPTDIVSYRKYPNGMLRARFVTKEQEKGSKPVERNHLLWIQLIEIDDLKYVKYRCDCKYFDYRQFRPAKRTFGTREIDDDIVIVVDPDAFVQQKKLFNIDKHAFLALEELFDHHVQISI
jgi:hypothetical protein